MRNREVIDKQLAAVEKEILRRKYLTDPVLWVQKRLGDHIWSGQQDIMRALVDNRKLAVKTCHGIGKSFIASVITAWWLEAHAPGEAFVVTTAPTGPQVKVILWKEIGRVHARGKLRGRVNQTEWMCPVNGKEEIIAMGRKPSDYSPTAFQGIHSPHVLVIVDEANGVRGQLWDALDSLIANDGSKMLAIFNPDDPSGEIFDACVPGSGWYLKTYSAFDTPNFTGEELPKFVRQQLIGPIYVEERRKKWAAKWGWSLGDSITWPNFEDIPLSPNGSLPFGLKCVAPPESKLEETHPFWQSKILGQFPVQSSAGSLIPLTWIRAAQTRTLKPGKKKELGLDVGASEDGDPSCLGFRAGDVFRILYSDREPDTMKTANRLASIMRKPEYVGITAKVDYIGVGRGVVDRLREMKLPVVPVTVNTVSSRPLEFANLLSELWWNVRERFELGEIDIDEDDEELAEELLMVRWEPDAKGRTVVRYSDEGPSPNRADALMLAFAVLQINHATGEPIGIEHTSSWTNQIDVGELTQSRWRV
jgi:hypothetical protein